jgi:hypothetical protein
MTITELIRRVNELALAKDAYWDQGVLKDYPTYPLMASEDDEPPPPPEEVELEKLLAAQPPETLYTLLALDRLGQARFPATEFEARRAALANEFTPAEVVAELTQAAYLPTGFRNAVERLRKRGVSVDSLRLTPA